MKMPATTVEARKRGAEAAAERTKSGRMYSPPVDIVEFPDELLLTADIPGAKPQDVDIHFDKGELTISARVSPREPQDGVYVVQEYGIGDYHRAFQIGEAIDHARIHAEISNGVLKLHLPKSEKAKPRKIAVTAG
jgi:HSP20 family molecular chaperone IbpA